MGKGSSKQAAAQDPAATAAAQGAVNKETAVAQAWLNNVNQNTPYGNLSYTQNGTGTDGTPRFQSDVTLSPEQQQILNNQNQQQIGLGNLANGYVGKIGDTLNQPFPADGLSPMQNSINYGSLSQVPQSADDFMALGDKTTNAMYSRLNPQFDRQEQSIRTQLANQGVMPGSEAWKNEFNDFGQQKNDAYQQAVVAGQNQANTAFNQSLAGHQQGASELSSNANFQNNARQQGLTEQSFLRQMPINEYNALSSGTQVQSPQFAPSQGAGQMQAPNLAQLYQNQQNTQQAGLNANAASKNQATSNLFSLGGSLGSAWIMSDKRLKKSIKKIGKTPSGFNVYEFKYIGGGIKQKGLMAQEIELIIPDAVIVMPNGFKAVNYAMVN